MQTLSTRCDCLDVADHVLRLFMYPTNRNAATTLLNQRSAWKRHLKMLDYRGMESIAGFCFNTGSQFMITSVKIKGTKEKKYSDTVLLKMGSSNAPNKNVSDINWSSRTATKEKTTHNFES